MKRLLLLVLKALILLPILYVFAYPPPIDPQPFHPEKRPSAMMASPGQSGCLQQADLLAPGEVTGPQDLAVGPDGVLYVGLRDGRIVRIAGDDSIQTVVSTGGRPSGMVFARSGPWAGHLLVADGLRGLLALSPDGVVYVLSTSSENRPFRFTGDLDIGSDGAIYFTDAGYRCGPDDFFHAILEALPNGRLLQYDPSTGTTRTIVEGLYFPRGVALSHDEPFVLVSETSRYRITRYWITGPRTGTTDIFLDNLPGFPGNLSRGSDC